jgi:lipid-A-disaccharide synthase
VRVFFSAGEASGDAYGAEIFRALGRAGAFSDERLARQLAQDALRWEFGGEASALRIGEWVRAHYGGTFLGRVGPNGSFDDLAREIAGDVAAGSIPRERLLSEVVSGVGGRALAAAGVVLAADSSDWGAVGALESLRVAHRVIGGFHQAKLRLGASYQGLFVPIDFGYINVRLARWAKRNGWKVLYFVPPGSWRRDRQGSDIPAVADAVVTPFPWSAKILRGMGADAHFFGHPLKQMVGPVEPHGPREGVAVMPGSRSHEVSRHLALAAETLQGFAGPVRILVAQNLDTGQVRALWRRFGGGDAEFRADKYQALKESRAAIVCSGTATLEAALCRCPSVVVYRVAPWTLLEYYVRRPRIEFVSLPNILLGRRLVPELLQGEARPDKVRSELDGLLEDGPARESQISGFDELDDTLGPCDAIDRTARLALDLADKS